MQQGHSFDISNTKILGHAKSRNAREFLEAWHSIQSSTINRHIDIPETYLQLKRLYPRQCPKPSLATTTQLEKVDTRPPNTTDPTNKRNELATLQPIRRSQRVLSQMLAGKKSHSLLTTARWIELKAQDQNRKSGEPRSRNFIYIYTYLYTQYRAKVLGPLLKYKYMPL